MWMLISPSSPTPTSRVPISSKLVSYIQNLLPFSPWLMSIISTLIGDILLIVITSILLAEVPGLIPSTGSKMNGSSWVPAPDRNSGVAVVFSGSGPSANSKRILSRFSISGISNNMSNNRSIGKHHIQLNPSSLTSSWPTIVNEISYDWLWAELFAQIVKLVISIDSVGVPRILPSSAASRAGLQPKVRPSGNSPLISQVATSPAPVIFGRKGLISWLAVSCRFWSG